MSAPQPTPSSAPALEVEQLSVTYGGIRAVKGISLRVEPGQIRRRQVRRSPLGRHAAAGGQGAQRSQQRG